MPKTTNVETKRQNGLAELILIFGNHFWGFLSRIYGLFGAREQSALG